MAHLGELCSGKMSAASCGKQCGSAGVRIDSGIHVVARGGLVRFARLGNEGGATRLMFLKNQSSIEILLEEEVVCGLLCNPATTMAGKLALLGAW